MGWLSRCFGCSTYGIYEDQYDEEMNIAIALSLSELEQIRQQNREDTAWLEEENHCARAPTEKERRQLVQAQLHEDEMIARTVQESWNESSGHCLEKEERQRAKAQVEEDEQLAKTIRNSLTEEENLPYELEEKDSQHAKGQLEEDEQFVKTVQESLYMEGSPPRAEEDTKDCTTAQIVQENLEAECSLRRREKGKKTLSEDRVGEDKVLAMALQESLDAKPPLSVCAGCNSVIEYGRPINFLGAAWHPQCFCCLACHKPIAVQEFSSLRGQFHKSCYKEHRRPKCYVCKEKIPSTVEGVKYREHPFWLEKYCPSHEFDGTPKCCSCERLEPWGINYVILDDGRRLCLDCFDSAIMDTWECQPLYFEIRDFFETLNLKVEKGFPLLLVESQALNGAKEKEKIDHQYAVVTRGLCLSEEHTVISISRGPKKGPNNQLIGMEKESQTLTRECEVTAILIMFGLPRLLTGNILAHEMMHAWLRLNGYRNLKPELEEGICQVLAHMWLESQTYSSVDAAAPSSSSYSTTTSKKGDQPEFERRLVDFFKRQIEEDDSPVYGDGFRTVNEAVLKYGVREYVNRPEFFLGR